MKNLVKYTIHVLGISAFLLGCNAEEHSGAEADSDELTFNTSLEGMSNEAVSRGYSGDLRLPNTGFTVAGFLTDGRFYDNEDIPETRPFPNVFDYQSSGLSPVVSLSQKDGLFKTPLPKIEHKEGTYLSFFAWADGNTANGYGITGATKLRADKGSPWLTVKMANVDAVQGDVVCARKLDHPNDYVVTAIDLDFRHILSKMTFVAQATDGATVNIKNIKLTYATNAGPYSTGKFSFGVSDSLGVWSGLGDRFAAGTYAVSGIPAVTLSGGIVQTLAEVLFVPQKLPAGGVTVSVDYTLATNGVESTVITRSAALPAVDLRQGKNQVYTLQINADAIDVINIGIAKWKEAPTGALPLVPGDMDANVLLLLEGIDAPYEAADGTLYWLDRSGWNRHCRIDNANASGQIKYNAVKKGYEFNSSVSGTSSTVQNVIRVPSLSTTPSTAMTCEVIAEMASSQVHTNKNLLYFSQNSTASSLPSSLQFAVYLNRDNKSLAYDYYSSGYRVAIPIYPDWTRRSYYAFTKGSGGGRTITYNKQYTNNEYSFSSYSTAFTNGVIGQSFKGVLNYLKITKTQLSKAQLEKSYDELDVVYKIDADPKFIPPPPITKDLKFYYDARTGIQNGQWRDLSGNNMHGEVNNVSFVSTGVNANSFSFSISPVSYIIVPNLGRLINSTVDFVAKTNSASTTSNVLFSFQMGSDWTYHRSFFVHFPLNGKVYIDQNIDLRMEFPASNINIYNWGHYNMTRSWSNKTIIFYRNNSKVISRGIGSAGDMSGADTNLCYIGSSINKTDPYYGNLRMVRYYTRALTEVERQANYDYDKTVFGF